MNIKKIKINELIPAAYNPRVELTEEDELFQKIKASIEEFGYVDPVIVNKRNNTIIGGHQRYMVLKKLGYNEIDCVIVNLDDRAEKRLNLALNKLNGSWDNEKLEELFEELELSEEEIFNSGFSSYEIENLQNDFINDLLEEDFSDFGKSSDRFLITFNISKEYEEQFLNYVKQNGKEKLIQIMLSEIEKAVSENA